MYKIIRSTDSLFNKEYSFNNYQNQLITIFENSLWESYIQLSNSLTVQEKEQINMYREKYLYNIKTENLSLEYSLDITIELLDQIISQKLENEMTIPLVLNEEYNNEDENNNANSNKKMSFRDFKEHLNGEESDNFEQAFRELAVLKENILNMDKSNLPYYYKLLNIQKIILSNLSKRNYSLKGISKCFRKFYTNIRDTIVKSIALKYIHSLSGEIKTEIINNYADTIIHNYLNKFRMGKTMEEGNKVVKEFKKNIVESEKYEFAVKQYSLLLASLNIDFEDWGNSFQKNLIKIFNEIIDNNLDFYEKISNIGDEWNDEKQNMLYLFQIVSNFVERDNDKKENLDILSVLTKEEIKQNISSSFNNFLTSNYTVVLLVKDLRAKDSYSKLKINDMEFVSDAFYENYQSDFYPNKKEHFFVRNEGLMRDHSYVMMHNIAAKDEDIQNAVQIAEKKLTNFLNLLYFFISKEKEHNFSISSRIAHLFDHTSRKSFIMRDWNEQSVFSESKLIDDVDESIVEYLHKISFSEKNWSSNILNAAYHFNEYCISKIIDSRYNSLIKMLESLFSPIDDIVDISSYSSALIAGSNYKKSDLSYGVMRKLLREDFEYYIKINEFEKQVPFKERIIERLKVFCKIIFSAFILHTDSLTEINDFSLYEIALWNIYLNPNGLLLGGKTNG